MRVRPFSSVVVSYSFPIGFVTIYVDPLVDGFAHENRRGHGCPLEQRRAAAAILGDAVTQRATVEALVGAADAAAEPRRRVLAAIFHSAGAPDDAEPADLAAGHVNEQFRHLRFSRRRLRLDCRMNSSRAALSCRQTSRCDARRATIVQSMSPPHQVSGCAREPEP